MSTLALKLIAENKKTKAKTLDLGNCGLTELPVEVLDCIWVEELILSSRWIEFNFETKIWELKNTQNTGAGNNQITFFPPTLSSLKLLTKLVFSDNQISELAPVAKLTNLQHLDCSFNQIEELAPIAQLTNLKILNCFNNQIAELAPIAQLTKLQHLCCYNNQIAELAPIAQLTKLHQLYCSNNQIAELAPIAQLTKLQTLNCSNNKIAELTPIAQLTNLQELYCSNNQIAELTPIAQLTKLQDLNCSNNQIAELTPIAQLTNLQYLLCSNNQIAELTPIAQLTNLQHLSCSNNQIAELTPIAQLTNLQHLYCSNNQIAELSPIARLTNLQRLYCSNNQIAELTPIAQLIKNGVPLKWEEEGYGKGIYVKGCPLDKSLIAAIKRGNAAVLKYLNKPKARLFEARVLVLGEPRAGKTTLRRKLKDTNAEMPKPTESTKAFEIEIEPYKCVIDKDGEANKMTYHLWDFGGQDYYRLLHQLFVAEQSVYLIVTGTDANKHEEELDFWLETIQRLGKDKQGNYGPVILLQNPQNDRNDLNFSDLKKRYKFWQQPENFIVNLNAVGKGTPDAKNKFFDKKELERFNHFKKYLEECFCHIEHIGKEMPTDWIRIKKELDKMKHKNLISVEEFRAVCALKGTTNPEEQDDLLAIFRTLGFLFHYESGALEGMVILNSEWITDALYRVLDDKIVENNKGWFVEADVRNIWHEPKYRDRAQALLDLMQEFKLSYYNEGSQKYIVPAKLPQDTEGLPEWDDHKNVHLRLQYDWLPRAIATQLIVTLHEHIVPIENGDQWVWRKGAVLDGRKFKLEDVQVRIQDFWKENRIDITARGESSELLIQAVMQKWREVNAPFEDKVEVTKIILCKCKVCAQSPAPHKFKYENVLNAKDQGKKLQCNESLEEFVATDILKGVFDESTVIIDAFQKKHGKEESKLMELLAAGDMIKAMDYLPVNDWGILLKNRYAQLKWAFTDNRLSYEEFSREQSKIVSDILTYVGSGKSMTRDFMIDESNVEMQIPKRRRSGDTIIHNYGQLNLSHDRIDNIVYSPKMGVSKADFESLQKLVAQLSHEKQLELAQEIAAMPAPKSESEKQSYGKRIFDWLNQNAEGIVVEVVSAAYYDGIKALFGG